MKSGKNPAYFLKKLCFGLFLVLCALPASCGDEKDDPGCTNECFIDGEKQCSGNGYQVCGNTDADPCLEWGEVTACGTGYYCSGGECFEISFSSIPAGCFDMGDAFNEGDANELPVHNVCISAFELSIYETTNAQYKACVDAGGCTAPDYTSSATRFPYYENSAYDYYPVIYVDWGQAKTFCEWVGGRLPTEAEWEYAARGGLAGKRYPWGDDPPTCTPEADNGAQYESCSPNDTLEVGSFAANGYGLYDIAGNVWEWVNDWYGSDYYSSSPPSDPTGPSSGSYRVLRGGCWNSNPYYLRVSFRVDIMNPTRRESNFGFRCVR